MSADKIISGLVSGYKNAGAGSDQAQRMEAALKKAFMDKPKPEPPKWVWEIMKLGERIVLVQVFR